MIEGLPKRIHSVGAGGAGMLPLTLYLADCGHDVTAEDDGWTEGVAELLESRGARLEAFRESDDVAIVYSSAIGADHPARAFARRTGCIAMRRGECLSVIAQTKRLIAIACSHGKTTTCGMLVDLFRYCGKEVDYVLGAQYVDGMPYAATGSEWLVAEIDESDGTIDLFSPEVCVVLNADHDHHARYATFEAYWNAFERLLRRTRRVAFVEAGLSARWDALSAAGSAAQIVWVGTGEAAEARIATSEAGPGWSEVTVTRDHGAITLAIDRLGRANGANAAFALLAAEAGGCVAPRGAAIEFRRIRRRQRAWYCSPDVRVFEDYAHHPSEIDAVLEQLGNGGDGRLVVVFQPHRYSRTKELKAGFARSLSRCDDLKLMEVYAASEMPLEGGMGEDLLRACLDVGASCSLESDNEALFRSLDATLAGAAGLTRILFLGAGVGDRLAKRYAERLAARDTRWGSVFAALGRGGGFATAISAQEPLANKTTLRVGGAAEMYLEPATLGELTAALEACHAAGIPAHPLGRGSNLVVPDEGVSGLVIRLGHPRWCRFETRPDGSVRVGAGLRIKTLCGQACREGLAGYEFLEGIPGSVGGVLRMNAGAMGGWAFDVVESVRYVTLAGEIRERCRASLEFGYRYCRELEQAIAVEAVLRSEKGRESQEELRGRIESYQNRRRESQPREPSAGCIFKNPDGDSAGRVIDGLGLKGTVVGGAEISLTHGNFIINRGGATAADVIELTRLARTVARERRGIDLHPEAMLFGSSWEKALS